jgi:hypothetical protein
MLADVPQSTWFASIRMLLWHFAGKLASEARPGFLELPSDSCCWSTGIAGPGSPSSHWAIATAVALPTGRPRTVPVPFTAFRKRNEVTAIRAKSFSEWIPSLLMQDPTSRMLPAMSPLLDGGKNRNPHDQPPHSHYLGGTPVANNWSSITRARWGRFCCRTIGSSKARASEPQVHFRAYRSAI